MTAAFLAQAEYSYTEYGATAIEPGNSNVASPPQRDTLTPREASVLNLILQGSTNRESGHALGISARTVEFHRANIMLKFGAKNVADLIRMVMVRR